LIQIFLNIGNLLLLVLVLLVEVAVVRPHLAQVVYQLEGRLILALREFVLDRNQVLELVARIRHHLQHLGVSDVGWIIEKGHVLMKAQEIKDLLALCLCLFHLLNCVLMSKKLLFID
jgi:hypothetical protein